MDKTAAERVVDTFFNAVREQAAIGNRVEIRRFGTFEMRERATKIGYNPYSKEKIAVPAGKKLHFKISADFFKVMNHLKKS
jgi:nucleoid DNA-binding protein